MTDEPTACISELNRLTQTVSHLLSDEKRVKKMVEVMGEASDFVLAVMGATINIAIKRLKAISDHVEALLIARMEARGLNPAGNVTQWNLPGQVVVTLEKKNRSKPAPLFQVFAEQLYEMLTDEEQPEEIRVLGRESLHQEWVCSVRTAQRLAALGGTCGELAGRLYDLTPEKPILKITMPGGD